MSAIALTAAALLQAPEVSQPSTIHCMFQPRVDSHRGTDSDDLREIAFFIPAGIPGSDFTGSEILDPSDLLEGRSFAWTDSGQNEHGRPRISLVAGNAGNRMLITLLQEEESPFQFTAAAGRVVEDRDPEPDYVGRCFHLVGPDAPELLEMIRSRGLARGAGE